MQSSCLFVGIRKESCFSLKFAEWCRGGVWKTCEAKKKTGTLEYFPDGIVDDFSHMCVCVYVGSRPIGGVVLVAVVVFISLELWRDGFVGVFFGLLGCIFR